MVANSSRMEQIRARLELPLVRRAAGLLEGHHRSILKGHGQDFDDLSLYSPGDDVGDIDWKSSARAGIPIIRRFVRQSNLSVILVADTGREMAALAAGGQPKNEVAEFLAGLIAYLARDRGDRVALVAGDAERLVQRPPRASTQDLEIMLHSLSRMYSITAPPSDLSALLRRVGDAFHRRSLIIVVTDESNPTSEHAIELRKLRHRHEIMFLAVADADPVALAQAGKPVADVTGTLRLPRFMQGRADVVAELEQQDAGHLMEVKALLTRESIPFMVVNDSDHALSSFVKLLGRYRVAGR